MVIVKDGVKHACLQCIRGHRVKKCNHQDRPLIPLLKRGRQVTQCSHCRNLRSSGSHVKCTCATSTVPNPLNGCLCEVIKTCTCVARHLQDTHTTNETKSMTTPLSPSTKQDNASCHSPIDAVTEASVKTTLSSATTTGDFGAGNLVPHDYLLSSFTTTAPDLSLSWITPYNSVDDNQQDTTPTTITPGDGNIDVLNDFLHQDINDLLLL
ncbi:copper fist DNA binding domain-containing protein [Chlamydoabsidia padenii]|nr:copper fist DNA binding domain-containing protein [Chlamydoabsidia padenii]